MGPRGEGLEMAWSWSHTQKAYIDAELNCRELPDDTLAVIWAEWRVSRNALNGWESTEFDSKRYPRELRRAYSWLRRGLRDRIVEEVWGWSSELRTCDNGGWNAWLCPFGCGCHCVPFDREALADA